MNVARMKKERKSPETQSVSQSVKWSCSKVFALRQGGGMEVEAMDRTLRKC